MSEGQDAGSPCATGPREAQPPRIDRSRDLATVRERYGDSLVGDKCAGQVLPVLLVPPHTDVGKAWSAVLKGRRAPCDSGHIILSF